MRQPDGRVALYASKDLTEAELRYQADFDDNLDLFEFVRPTVKSRMYHVTVGMRTFTYVVAESYEQALRTLFKNWSPEPGAARLEIER